MKTDRKKMIQLILIAVMVLAIVVIIICKTPNKDSGDNAADIASEISEVREEKAEQKETSVIKIEKEITAETIEDGINDMGVMLCGEYYFTDVISYSSVKKILNIKMDFTESSYLASYDGVVTAGIDLSEVEIEKDDVKKVISVKMPDSAIQNVDIDPESFVLYSEKTGLGNPVSVEDFNDSIIELEKTAKAKAIEQGLLERSDENAEKMVSAFISSMVDMTQYSINYV